jgi:hypothetical protein
LRYRALDIEGEFITQVIVSNVDGEDLYYFELYHYDCDVDELEFEEYPNRDMILAAIEDELDRLKDSFLSWHMFDLFDCVSLHDINTAEDVEVSDEEKELLKVSGFAEHIINLESYEIEEL